jgi:hypothetical protein
MVSWSPNSPLDGHLALEKYELPIDAWWSIVVLN